MLCVTGEKFHHDAPQSAAATRSNTEGRSALGPDTGLLPFRHIRLRAHSSSSSSSSPLFLHIIGYIQPEASTAQRFPVGRINRQIIPPFTAPSIIPRLHPGNCCNCRHRASPSRGDVHILTLCSPGNVNPKGAEIGVPSRVLRLKMPSETRRKFPLLGQDVYWFC